MIILVLCVPTHQIEMALNGFLFSILQLIFGDTTSKLTRYRFEYTTRIITMSVPLRWCKFWLLLHSLVHSRSLPLMCPRAIHLTYTIIIHSTLSIQIQIHRVLQITYMTVSVIIIILIRDVKFGKRI